MELEFLTLEEVIELHKDQIDRYGGSHGIRDMGLLPSAVAMPQSSFGGEYLHSDIHEMAAAYLFHIVRNHPFLDGNKRAGTVAALVFLELHGKAVRCEEEALVELVLGVAQSRVQKGEVAAFLRGHAGSSRAEKSPRP